MDQRQQIQLVAIVIGALAYWFLVLSPWMDRVGDGVIGADAVAAAEKDLERARLEQRKARTQIADLEKKLRASIGTVRYSEGAGQPLEELLARLQATSRKTGVSIQSVGPIGSTPSGFLRLNGLRAVLTMDHERQLFEFLHEVQSAPGEPRAMVRSLAVNKGDAGGFTAQLSVSFLVPTDTSREKLKEYESVEVKRARWDYHALLEARPPPPAPPPPPRPVVRPSIARVPPSPSGARARPGLAPEPAPAPAPFTGKLLGVSTIGSRDIALLQLDGRTELIDVGSDVGGWKLDRVEPGRAVLSTAAGAQTEVYMDEDDRPAPAPSAPAPPPAARVATPPSLGLDGEFRMAGGQPPPPPFSTQRRVFTVTSVSEGGLAQRAGLRRGDRIITLDGHPLMAGDLLRGARARLASGATIPLDVERNRSMISLELRP